ncbi:hypothetical protein F5Y04DRAFT_275216 [Hypomontagnella monticulosa]|nr:hypothetical protein F5Y04DRAFT_275216 [Hypomontagnella monticulosa]
MAEALALIGSLAAIMQLTDTFAKLAKDLVVCVRTMRAAPEEIKGLLLEISIFTDLLYSFHDQAEKSTSKMDAKAKARRGNLVQKIERQCKFVKRGFARLVRRFVEINTPDSVPLNALWARILWLWKKPDVPELRLSLQSATVNVILLCHIFTFEELVRNNENSEKIAKLQKRLQTWVSTAKRLRHELEEYQRRKQPSDNMPDMKMDESYDAIAEDTRELERYVVRAIRSHAQEAALSASSGSSYQRPREPPGPPGPLRGDIRSVSLPLGTKRYVLFNARKNADGGWSRVPVESPSSTRASIGLRVEDPQERSPSRTRGGQPLPPRPKSEIHDKTFGDRVRDQGHGVYSEVGEWPAESCNPNDDLDEPVEIPRDDQQSDDGRSSCSSCAECAECLEEKQESASKVKLSSSPQNAESSKTAQGDVSQTPHVAEERSEPRDPRSSVVSEQELSRHSSFEGSPGPYRPVPPFGGPRSRRRPRRPRTQSPIG